MLTILKVRNKLISRNDTQKILLGKLLAARNFQIKAVESLQEVEFKVFSQWGDDGIIQYLIEKIGCKQKTFIEFGVEDFHESNTRFLLMNNNWKGLVIDGSKKNIKSIQSQDIYWKYDINAINAFITKENINELIANAGFSGEIGILSVDIDGNDFWILEQINVVKPEIVIVEFNSVFGCDRYISIPYDANFYRSKAHFSNLYWGASLPAFHHWASEHGYTLIGCNSNGNNAYFIRDDKMVPDLPTPTLLNAFVTSNHRESRNQEGKLNYITGNQRIEVIRGLPVVNVRTNKSEQL